MRLIVLCMAAKTILSYEEMRQCHPRINVNVQRSTLTNVDQLHTGISDSDRAGNSNISFLVDA